jgi:hypothetical protein
VDLSQEHGRAVKALGALVATLCVLAGASVQARMPGGTSPQARPHAADGWKGNPQAEDRLWDFARCAVRRDRKLSAWVLETPPLAPEAQRRTLTLFTVSRCTDVAGSIKMKNDVVRWALAEQLYVGGGSGAPVAVAAGDGYALGACVARREPVRADAFVRTSRRSAGEKTALAALVPAINACSGKARMQLSGAEMHGVLGEALYRMRGAAVQGKN